MKKIFVLSLLLLNVCVSVMATPAPALPEKWKKWLNEEVVYIITPKEKEIFLTLNSEREREAFEKAFWLQETPPREPRQMNLETSIIEG